MNPLGLYIHIPFCKRKCAYCDFVSYPGCETEMDHYIDNVTGEARLYADALFSRQVDTVFIGGGTPSLLRPEQFVKLVEGLKANCNWDPVEFTVEANPETLDAAKLAAYADCGVNRISIGLQTHDDDILARIGRRHTWEVFLRAYEEASRHFNNINTDTIFGLPRQTLQSYLETLRRVIALGKKHISSYALKLEAGTPLAAEYIGAEEDLDREMYHAGIRALENAGLLQYETSNFAVPGYECRHNLKYWTGAEYLGLGVAAYSMLKECRTVRFGNVHSLKDYARMVEEGCKPVRETEDISLQDEKDEYIMLRLRLKRGIDFSEYYAKFNENFIEAFGEPILSCIRDGLLIRTQSGVSATTKGFDLQNSLIGKFIN